MNRDTIHSPMDFTVWSSRYHRMSRLNLYKIKPAIVVVYRHDIHLGILPSIFRLSTSGIFYAPIPIAHTIAPCQDRMETAHGNGPLRYRRISSPYAY